MNLEVVILAAGKGTRMCSNIPKVLHKVGNKELLNHMIEKAENLSADKIHIVYGYKGELIKETIKGDYDWCYQEQQLGTADAVKVALPNCSKNSKILILVSDIPLIEEQTLKNLIYSFDLEFKVCSKTGICLSMSLSCPCPASPRFHFSLENLGPNFP